MRVAVAIVRANRGSIESTRKKRTAASTTIRARSPSPERVAAMAADDWRRRSPQFQEPALSRNLALRDALRPIARRHDTSVAAIAVAWTIAWPGVTGAIVGARSPEQVDGWIDAAGIDLTAHDLDEIATALEGTGAGTGATKPPQPTIPSAR